MCAGGVSWLKKPGSCPRKKRKVREGSRRIYGMANNRDHCWFERSGRDDWDQHVSAVVSQSWSQRGVTGLRPRQDAARGEGSRKHNLASGRKLPPAVSLSV